MITNFRIILRRRYFFLLIRKRSEIRSANPVTASNINRLKFPELKIESLYSWNRSKSEKANANTRNDTKQLSAVIFFS